MPIQFTCPHCGQLLSVARRKVGQAVQCVSCAGGVVVPPPLPSESGSYSDGPETAPDDAHEAGVPMQEPSSRPFARSPGAWNTAVPVTRMALYSIGGMIVGVSIVSFLLGWAMGHDAIFNQVSGTPTGVHRIFGRISYTTSRGRTVADSESVVIALPVNEKPDQKLEIKALRPDVPIPNGQHPTILGIRSIGGDFARANRTGDFRLEVPAPGEYFILVVSSHLPRSDLEPPTTKEIVELGQYFKQPDTLLGKNDFVWSKQIVRDEKRFEHLFRQN